MQFLWKVIKQNKAEVHCIKPRKTLGAQVGGKLSLFSQCKFHMTLFWIEHRWHDLV